MFRNFGNYLLKEVLSPVRSPHNNDLSPEYLQKIKFFNEKAIALVGISNVASGIDSFMFLIDLFLNLFYKVSEKNKDCVDIESAMTKYCGICAKFGIAILNDRTTSSKMFESIVICKNFLGFVPHSAEFMPMFSHIMNVLQQSSEYLGLCDKFLKNMFLTEDFFKSFYISDGFTMVLQSFYFNSDQTEIQEFFLNVLYRKIPLDYFKSDSVNTHIFVYFIEYLNENATSMYPYANLVTFVLQYLSCFGRYNKDYFFSFHKLGGFSILNHLFLHHCPEISVRSYETLLIESSLTDFVLTGLLDLYNHELTNAQTRSQIIPLLSISIRGLSDTYQKINIVAPISSWILLPPLLDSNGLLVLHSYLSELYQKRVINVISILSKIIKLASPSGDPCTSHLYLELLHSFLTKGDVNPALLCTNLFLEHFLFLPTINEITRAFQSSQMYSDMISTVYLSDVCKDLRSVILDKLLGTDSELCCSDEFSRFFRKILCDDFSPKFFHFIRVYLDHNQLFQALCSEVEKKSDSFSIFMSSDNFPILTSLCSINPQFFPNILKLLFCFSSFGPKKEIDEWVCTMLCNEMLVNQCKDSSIVHKIRKSYVITIPSLIPFIGEYDNHSPLNLFLVGKYAIDIYQKVGYTIDQIPNIIEISRRYISYKNVLSLIDFPELLLQIIDLNKINFSIFEFVPSKKYSYLSISRPFSAVTFWVNIPNESTNPVPIFKCQILSIVFQSSSIVVSSKKEQIALPFTCGNWNHICINVYPKMKKINRVEIFLNGQQYGKMKTLSEDFPSFLIFGDDNKSLYSTMHLSKSIFLSDSPFSPQQASVLFSMGPNNISPLPGLKTSFFHHSDMVYDVPCFAFASHFKDWVSLELIISHIEQTKNPDDFASYILVLIKLQKMNRLRIVKFWTRLVFLFKEFYRFVERSFQYLMFDVIVNNYSSQEITEIMFILLTQLEYYFLYNSFLLTRWISRITCEQSEKIIQWDHFETNKYQCFFYSLVRSEPDIRIISSLLPVFSKSLLFNPSVKKMKSFLSFIISLNCHNSYSNETQKVLFECFVTIIKEKIDTVFFSLNQILDMMVSFPFETAKYFFEIIAIFSSRSQSFFIYSQFAGYIFSKFYNIAECWGIAFSILSGNMPHFEIPQTVSINRMSFCPCILDMLLHLLNDYTVSIVSDESKNELEKLITDVIGLLLKIPIKSLLGFSQKGFYPVLYSLLNLGLFPTQYINENSEYVNLIFMNNEINNLTIDEKKLAYQLCDHDPLLIFESIDQIDSEDLDFCTCNYLRNVDIGDLNQEKISTIIQTTQILTFLVNILLSSDNPNFSQLFIDFMGGNSLIPYDYRILITQELVFSLLIQMTNPDSFNGRLYKHVLLIIHRASIQSLFHNRYLHLLSLLFNFLKTIQISRMIIPFFEDMQAIASYREILLSIFIFVKNDGLAECFNLINNFETLVFNKYVFADISFSLFWLHLMRSNSENSQMCIKCMSQVVSIIDKNLLSSYNSEEQASLWAIYSSQILQPDDSLLKNRMNRLSIIIENMQNMYIMINKHHEIHNVFRKYNFLMHDQLNRHYINLIMRRNERSSFSVFLRKQKIKMNKGIIPSSYYHSLISMPFSQSRAMSVSPFPIPNPGFQKSVIDTPFSYDFQLKKCKVPLIESESILQTDYQLYPFYTSSFSPFEYSPIIPMKKSLTLKLFELSFQDLGAIHNSTNVLFLYFIHTIPSIIFHFPNHFIILLLAEIIEGDIVFQKSPQSPIAFLPLTQSISIGDYSETSLFCGHVALIMNNENICFVKRHFYIHKPIGLSLHSLYSPPIIIIFHTISDIEYYEKTAIRHLQSFSAKLPQLSLVTINQQNVSSLTNLWVNRSISNYQYLLLLNFHSSRSLLDLSQYLVFPWVISPNKESRDLSIPMGQIGKPRSEHYDQTFEMSDPKYYYGFHYSLPGAVFWLLMRIPPFIYFHWDLNHGWDESSRLFSSISDAYNSASGSNPSDLKELVPEMYILPEAYENCSKITFQNPSHEKVSLPEWSNGNQFFFISVFQKHLNESESLHEWIDLIFGYKQTGEASILSKNVFLPTSYHSSTPESLDMENDVFESQSINFGQCPVQLFSKPHPSRNTGTNIHPSDFHLCFKLKIGEIYNPLPLKSFSVVIQDGSLYAIPKSSCVLNSYNSYFCSIERENEALVIRELISAKTIIAIHSSDFSFVEHIHITHDSMFLIISYSIGRVDSFIIRYDSNNPTDIKSLSSFSYPSKCMKSQAFLNDLICVSQFEDSLILWNICNGNFHRRIQLPDQPIDFVLNQSEATITCLFSSEVIQYTINSHLLRRISIENHYRCMNIYSLSDSFSHQILLFGTNNGLIDLYYADEDNYQLKKAGTKQISNHSIELLKIYPETDQIIIMDCKDCAYIIDVDRRMQKCSQCGRVSGQVCARCQKPMCSCCLGDSKVCKDCFADLEHLSMPADLV